MRMFKRFGLIAAAAAIFLGTAAGAASAATAPQWAHSQVRLTGGQTSVTTAPGIATALLAHGIVPLAILPGTEGAQIGSNGVAVRFTFPVTGGTLNPAKLTATINHQGGILFIDPATGKQIAVSDFTISLGQRVLTAIVNGNPKARVPLLTLSLASAKIRAGRHFVQVSGIITRLTKAAASALDATFGTSPFTPGLELGTARTLLLFR